jgi:hypothetical protein
VIYVGSENGIWNFAASLGAGIEKRFDCGIAISAECFANYSVIKRNEGAYYSYLHHFTLMSNISFKYYLPFRTSKK